MKKLSTKKILFLSLNELSQKMPVSKITIEDITSNCGLKRGIFYYYFKDKEDLVQSTVAEHILQSYKECYQQGSWVKLLEHSMEFSYEYHQLIRNFYKNYEWYEKSFFIQMEEYINDIVTIYYRKKYDKKVPKEIQHAISFYTAGSLRLYQQWVCSANPLTPAEMAENINMCVPECLKEALNGGKEI